MRFFSLGIECMNSIEWILQYSETARIYKEDTTILCWIYSNENGCLMSSIDLHFQQLLEDKFCHIQAMVVEVSGNSVKNFEAYQLNKDGHGQLSRCCKKPGKIHIACDKTEFYEKASYDFDNLTISITDFRENHYVDKPIKNLDGDEVVTDVFNYDDFPILNVDGNYDLPEKAMFHYPQGIIEKFEEKAKRHVDNNGKLIELMAYVVGFKDDDNVLVGTELIYPEQYATNSDVTDGGM